MKTLIALLSTALLAGALTTQAAPPIKNTIPISSVPFTISAPGNYVLINNLAYNSTDSNFPAAITINAPSGAVILDLQGFTISRDVNTGFSNVGVAVKSSNATVRNGKLQGFDREILAGDFTGFLTTPISNIQVNHMTLDNSLDTDIQLVKSIPSLIDNCTFTVTRAQSATQYGIRDTDSQTGNRYTNNFFDGAERNRLTVDVFAPSFGPPVILDNCQFSPPKK